MPASAISMSPHHNFTGNMGDNHIRQIDNSIMYCLWGTLEIDLGLFVYPH